MGGGEESSTPHGIPELGTISPPAAWGSVSGLHCSRGSAPTQRLVEEARPQITQCAGRK